MIFLSVLQFVVERQQKLNIFMFVFLLLFLFCEDIILYIYSLMMWELINKITVIYCIVFLIKNGFIL